MLKAFLRQTSVPLRVRKKLGKLTPVPQGLSYTVKLFENDYQGITGNHLDDKTYLYGMHEPASIRFMRGVLRLQRLQGLSPIYLDIGTNTGAHLLGVASLADKAYGFEPWAPVRERAQQNVARNPLAHVSVMGFGLGDADTALPFAPPVAGNHGTGSFFRQDDANSTTLQVRRGDAFVAEQGITPTLIKIDTEGFERPILQGLADTMRTHKPAVVFEYSAMSRPDFANGGLMTQLFGEGHVFYGLKRSREYPSVEAFVPGRRYENLIAWPKDGPSIEDALKLTRR